MTKQERSIIIGLIRSSAVVLNLVSGHIGYVYTSNVETWIDRARKTFKIEDSELVERK